MPLTGSSAQTKVLFNASASPGSAAADQPEHKIKPRSGGFMKSLKKMVNRDSKKEPSPDHRATAVSKPPPARPPPMDKDHSQDHSATAVSKLPPARPPPMDKHSQDHSATAEPKSPPARPPPMDKYHSQDHSATAEPKSPPARPPPVKPSVVQEQQVKMDTEQKHPDKETEAVSREPLSGPVNTEAKSSPVPKPRQRRSDDKTDKPEEPVSVEEKKEVKVVSQVPSRPPPPKTSPSEKRKISIPSKPPLPKKPVIKTSSNSLGENNNSSQSTEVKSPTSISQSTEVESPTSISDKPKPMPVPHKDTQPDLTQKSNGSVIPSTPPAPVPIPRQKSASPPPDNKSPTNPTGTNFYKATKDYKAQTDSELSFSSGDVIIFMERRDKGFYYGMLDNGLIGIFPSSHVEPFFR